MVERPRLKAVTVHRSGAELVIWPRALQRVYLADPAGSIAALLRLLSAGLYRTGELRGAMALRGSASGTPTFSRINDAP